jgi:hypothetical protein
MNDPIDALNGALRDEWADPLGAATTILHAIRSLAEGEWSDGLTYVRRLRTRRADSPIVLAVTEPALDPDARKVAEGLDDVERILTDTKWTQELALRLIDHGSLGVVSLGDATLSVLEMVAFGTAQDTELFVDRAAVARGLGYLHLPIVIAPPEESDAVLVPAVAKFRSRIWTTARSADVALRAGARSVRVVPVLHPIRVLSPLGRRAYRPASILVDVEV